MRMLQVLGLCLLTAAALSAQGPASRAADEAAVREVVRQYVEVREARNAAGIEALFTEDADQLTSSGEWRRGRAALVPGTLASSERTGGTRTITVETVRFPVADVAIADGRYEISGLEGGSTRRMWTTFVMTRAAGGWQISAIRNMLPAAMPPGR